MDAWDLYKGDKLEIDVTVRDANGEPITGTYTGGETLALTLWRGDTQTAATLATSTYAWVSATAGTSLVTITSADSANLSVGLWRGRATVVSGGEKVTPYEFTLDVKPIAAATADLATYCTYTDVVREAPWVAELIARDPSAHGDLEEYRAMARQEFDAIVQRHWRGATEERQTTLDHLLDGGKRRTALDDSTLTTWLSEDRVVLTGNTGRRIVRWNALMTAYYIASSQIGTGDGKTAYQDFAKRCRLEAASILPTLSVGIDTTSTEDGVADIVIDLGTFDTLRG